MQDFQGSDSTGNDVDGTRGHTRKMQCLTCRSKRGIYSDDGMWTCSRCGDEWELPEVTHDDYQRGYDAGHADGYNEGRTDRHGVALERSTWKVWQVVNEATQGITFSLDAGEPDSENRARYWLDKGPGPCRLELVEYERWVSQPRRVSQLEASS